MEQVVFYSTFARDYSPRMQLPMKSNCHYCRCTKLALDITAIAKRSLWELSWDYTVISSRAFDIGLNHKNHNITFYRAMRKTFNTWKKVSLHFFFFCFFVPFSAWNATRLELFFVIKDHLPEETGRDEE